MNTEQLNFKKTIQSWIDAGVDGLTAVELSLGSNKLDETESIQVIKTVYKENKQKFSYQ